MGVPTMKWPAELLLFFLGSHVLAQDAAVPAPPPAPGAAPVAGAPAASDTPPVDPSAAAASNTTAGAVAAATNATNAASVDTPVNTTNNATSVLEPNPKASTDKKEPSGKPNKAVEISLNPLMILSMMAVRHLLMD